MSYRNDLYFHHRPASSPFDIDKNIYHYFYFIIAPLSKIGLNIAPLLYMSVNKAAWMLYIFQMDNILWPTQKYLWASDYQ